MTFRITGLDPSPFLPFYGQDETALAAVGVQRVMVTAPGSAPDRIELRDAAPGEHMLLLNYEHQPVPTAYRSRHAIYVREGATDAARYDDTIPPALAARPISLRAFDTAGEMIDAELCDGADLAPLIERMFADERSAYLHAHYARRGCYAALVERN